MNVLSVIEHCNKQKIDALLLSFDFEKAFDKVEWNVLYKTLTFFSYGEKIISMIKVLYVDIQSCMLNNGSISDWFTLTHGLRQECCLSTTPFTILIEVLGLKIQQNQDILGITIFDQHKTHDQYADDMWTLIQNKQEVFDALIHTFDDFYEFSGLRINYEKYIDFTYWYNR